MLIKLKTLLPIILNVEGLSKATIYRIMKLKLSGIGYIRGVVSVRPAKIFNKSSLLKIKRLVDHRDGINKKNKIKMLFT